MLFGRQKIMGIAVVAEDEKQKRFVQLTPHEYEMCLFLLEGFTLRESAKQLSIKYFTAKTYMTGIYMKLGVKSRAELIINYSNINEKSIQAQ